MEGLHRRVILRLLAGFIVLSFAIGSIVVYFDLEAVDEKVVSLAEAAAEDFLQQNHTALLAPDRSTAATTLGDAATRLLAGNHFVIVEIYDAQQRQIVERGRPGYRHVEMALDRSQHRFPTDTTTHYNKHLVAGLLYLQMVTPIRSADGRIVAYFEGIYEVDETTMAEIRQRLLHSLAIAIVAVMATSILLYPVILSLNRGVIRYAERLLRANLDMLEVLGSAIAKRDSDTDTHNYRVTWYAVRLGEAVDLEPPVMRQLIKGAFLHDVGKIGISDSILLKPGKLTAEEFAAMQQHVALGLDIIGQSEWLADAGDVVRYHHEKYDGSGYLGGLAGEAIPLTARIFAIVDVFDALTSRRPYKEPMPLAQAMGILEEGIGRHFDPRLLATFRAMAGDLLAESTALGHDGMRAALQRLIGRYFFA